jgi:hypothetical protein
MELKWSVSRSGSFNDEESTPDAHLMGGQVWPRAHVDVVAKRESIALTIGITCYYISFRISYTEHDFRMHPVSHTPRVPNILQLSPSASPVQMYIGLHVISERDLCNWHISLTLHEPGYLSRYSGGLPAGRPGFDSRQGQEFFLYSMASRPTLEPTQPPIQWVPEALSQGVKRPGCEADH